MPLRLIPPGKRKANRYYLIRGTLDGRRLEVSTHTRDQASALRTKARLELRALDHRVPRPGETITFGQGIEIYRAWRLPSKADGKRLDALKDAIGDKVLPLTHAELVAAANDLKPAAAAATKNREVLRPAAAVLHHCAETGFIPWLRIKLFREPRPATRGIAIGTAQRLVSGIPERPADRRGNLKPATIAAQEARQRKKRLLLVWLFRQGMRISDALKIAWPAIDLDARTVVYHVGKADRPDVIKPLHDEVFELLANEPNKTGRLFPWTTKSGVYKWLRPYCRARGVRFTPHMARHSLGKWLNEDGASLRSIMDALDHDDERSSVRYQSTDIEALRARGRRLGKLTG